MTCAFLDKSGLSRRTVGMRRDSRWENANEKGREGEPCRWPPLPAGEGRTV